MPPSSHRAPPTQVPSGRTATPRPSVFSPAPPGQRLVGQAGSPLPPRRRRQPDLVGQWPDQRRGSLGQRVYQQILLDLQDNVAEADGLRLDVPISTAYRAASGVSTRGFEMEVSGELMPDWNVQGGYTYRHSEDKDGAKVSTTQPEQILRLATTYRLPGALNRMTVGGNVSWQSKIHYDTTLGFGSNAIDAHFEQKAYTLVGLMTAYDFSRNLRGNLNLNNLTDRKYFSGMGSYGSTLYGDPRNIMASLKYDF
ncbi:TonB-dependent receptor domain-containing protein [Pseudomonas sp. MYb187]|uniref:TonB-dependent receptor domain-containing protein n=1 Tax=Pseudomonas sp. MYb187 TaxID=1827299 RepID=UPI003531DA0D